jgi:hypothetical protein
MAAKHREEMKRPDLVFLTLENKEKIEGIVAGRIKKVRCPSCNYDSFGPHECPAIEK